MRPALLPCGVAAVAAAAAGCGASEPHSGARTHPRSQLAVARCMRAHGVTGFPDPITGQGGQGFSVTLTPGTEGVNVNGTMFGGPAFTSAAKACGFAGGGARPVTSESQKVQLVKFARCMRAHGIHWADPRFPAGGGVLGGGPPRRVGRVDPAVTQAAKICNRRVGL